MGGTTNLGGRVRVENRTGIFQGGCDLEEGGLEDE